MIKFENMAALERWLADNGIDTTSWGIGDAKTVNNLWDELLNGDCRLQAEPPLRLLEVVQILVQRGDYILIEAEQEFHNGQRRRRHLLPSEKMKTGEDYEKAAVRCLYEELGVNATAISFSSHYKKLKTIIDSPSYPGLPTQYVFHEVKASVDGLPFNDFWRDNTAHKSGDPVRRHRWTWQLASNLLSLSPD